MPPATRGQLGSVLGEKPISSEPEGPWRVTARISGGLLQISNHHESRVIRKAEVETYLRKGKPW
jgi:hypothetical protein